MNDENLKAAVLAHGMNIAPTLRETQFLHGNIGVTRWEEDLATIDSWLHGKPHKQHCILDPKIDAKAHSSNWWIAAKLLDIPTEPTIEEAELELSIRQHYHELKDAHDAGFTNGNEHGVHMTIEQSWESFIGDYGKEEIKQ